MWGIDNQGIGDYSLPPSEGRKINIKLGYNDGKETHSVDFKLPYRLHYGTDNPYVGLNKASLNQLRKILKSILHLIAPLMF